MKTHHATRSTDRVKGTFVGVDIGSSAVRAAEIIADGNRRVLRRLAQVDLERGAVVDGEILNVAEVGRALVRLWDEGSFSTRKVIVGVSSQRVIVRPAEVAAMPEEDFRLALQFEAQELIPIPVEQAVLDFTILEPSIDTDAATGTSRMRILLAAAHRDMIRGHLEALKQANLEPIGIDVLPLALLRAVPEEPAGDDGIDAVVSLGSDLTTVAIREGGSPRFTRTVGLGGSKLTNSIASDLSFQADEAEGLKRNMDAPVQVLQRVREVLQTGIRPIVNEVNSSLDYFLAQAECGRVDRVIVTGGASRTEGLIRALERSIDFPVIAAEPYSGLTLEDFGLAGELSSQALAPIGIALWGVEAPTRRLSLLPPEILLARRQRRVAKRAAASVAGLAVLLGGVWGLRHVQVAHVNSQVAGYAKTNQNLQAEVASMAKITQLKANVATQRAMATQALSGSVDWVKLLGQIAAVMPSNESLTSFGATKQVTAPSPAPGKPAGPAPLGSVQMAITGKNGQESVAEWLRALAKIPSLSGVAVGGSSASGATDHFTSTAQVNTAGASNRAASLPGAKQ